MSLLRKDIRKWLLTGLLIRLAVMPFTTHSDLLSIYYRAHLLLERRPFKGFGPNLFSLLHAGFLWLFKPLIPYASIWGNPRANTYELGDWMVFVNTSYIFRELFLFKLPYLVFEALAVWMLIKLSEPDRTVKAVAFWMLNPVVIFSTYIFGRFDIVVVFLLLSALYLVKLNRDNEAMIVLGLAVLLRVYPIILVLPFALILKTDSRARWRLAGFGLLPLLASILAGLSSGEARAVKGLAGMQHLEYPLTMKFYLFNQDNLYVFVFLYSLVILYLLLNTRHGFSDLVRYCFYVVVLFFATSFFHPHYFIWLAPFAALYTELPQFLPVHRLQIAAWVTYTFQWGRSLAGYLLAPLSPAFFWSVMSPSEWIDRFYPSIQVVGIARSFFSAACLAMAYVVWRESKVAMVPADVNEPAKERVAP